MFILILIIIIEKENITNGFVANGFQIFLGDKMNKQIRPFFVSSSL